MLTRDQILSSNDVVHEDVDVPEWGGSVRVRVMSGLQRDAWEQSLVGRGGGELNITNIRARLVAACAVGEDGQPLFTLADAEALGQKSFVALDRVANVAQRLNKLTKEELEDAKGN